MSYDYPLILPNDDIYQFYEGSNPDHYSELTGHNLNRAPLQLMENIRAIRTRLNNMPYTPPGGIVEPGGMGFGVGVYPNNADLVQLNLTPLSGYNDPTSMNYGNYVHTTGSIMVYVPAFYVRFGHPSSIRYAQYGANAVDILSINNFTNEAQANAAGYILPRAFIDGGVQKKGFFIDKYLCSNTTVDKTLPLSVAGGIALFVGGSEDVPADIAYLTRNIPGCDGTAMDALRLSKNRGTHFTLNSAFMHAAIRIITTAQAQTARSTVECGWYTTNSVVYPKGMTTLAYGANTDYEDKTLTFTAYYPIVNSLSIMSFRAGSGSNISKTTHNGQLNGIVDIRSNLYTLCSGLTYRNYNNSSSGNYIGLSPDLTIFTLKQSVKISELTTEINTGKGIIGDVTHLNTLYDQFTPPAGFEWYTQYMDPGRLSYDYYWINGNNSQFKNDFNGVHRAMNALVPPDINAVRSNTTPISRESILGQRAFHSRSNVEGSLFGSSHWNNIFMSARITHGITKGSYGAFRVAAYIPNETEPS